MVYAGRISAMNIKVPHVYNIYIHLYLQKILQKGSEER